MEGTDLSTVKAAPTPGRRSFAGWLLAGALGFILAYGAPPRAERRFPAPPRPAPTPAPSAELLPHTPVFGPIWPPTEADWLDEIVHDTWVHPLSGPIRRMPVSDSRIFGAERPGDRPGECRHGHCGVDIGGEIWGEHVLAAHDGVVDRVQRGPNDDHGGVYIRLGHRGGTIFTQYFHLAAAARWVQPGVSVAAGDVIGLLGDTGVKDSTAHLHFTISVRPSKDYPEMYMDPEPLIALWALRIPAQGTVTGLVATQTAPGVPWTKTLRKKLATMKVARKRPTPKRAKPAAAPPPAPSEDADSSAATEQEGE
jgi:murein DD-endopeptidase MepM/ murein hydrolase activator NlpD